MENINVVSLKMVRDRILSFDNITSPDIAYDICDEILGDCDRENIIVICLDSQNKPTNISIVGVGSITSAIAEPREIFKTAILSNSNSIIIAHNHPSGEIKPSHADIFLTKRLIKCGTLLGIKVLDHIIVGDKEYFSFKENYTCNFDVKDKIKALIEED